MSLGLSKATIRAYVKAMKDFKDFCKAERMEMASSMDDLVVQYVMSRKKEKQRNILEKLLAAICHFLPKERSNLWTARRLLTQLKRVHKPSTKPPMIKDVLMVLMLTLCQMGKFCSAIAMYVQFDCFLRPNELCNLKVEDIAFPGDICLGSFIKCGVLFLEKTKTGPMQIVEIREKVLMILLKRIIENKRIGDKLFPSYKELSRNFHAALKKLKLDTIGYTLHSLRHGAATQEFLNTGFGSMPAIMHRGRWESASVKKYLQGGAALLVHTILPRWIITSAKEIEKRLEQLFGKNVEDK